MENKKQEYTKEEQEKFIQAVVICLKIRTFVR